ncbi:hypothetical protein LCGC14_1841100 [marine sediment metagenome]|uniref:Uncharacterized protein n=1 Tax=marine sediment metagenome TaxID=412755 RepID=A0A0F9ISR9_9ZZZZ
MKFLMLRGQVPQDRNPQEIVFDTLDKLDDMWSLLLYSLLHKDDQAELWYWNGNRSKQFTPNFIERWVPSFSTYKGRFNPDVIFCRDDWKGRDWEGAKLGVKVVYLPYTRGISSTKLRKLQYGKK